MPTFSESFGPVSAQKVAAVERRLGVKFPRDYKQFLRTVNGGIPEPHSFLVPGWGGACLDFLFGIGSTPDVGNDDLRVLRKRVCDLEYQQKLLDLPPGLIAIGIDPGADILLLRVSEPNVGRVFFFDRKGFWVGPGGQNIFPVADSFAAFLDSLHQEKAPDG